MFRLALRSARAHWRRLVLTTLAVVLGTSFVIGSFVLSDTISASINRLIDSSAGRVDLVVRPANADAFSGPQDGIRSAVPIALADAVAKVRGVGAVNVTVVGAGQIVDGTTEATTGGPGRGIALVTSWPDHLDLTSASLVSGRPPSADDELVVDADTASTKRLKVGGTVKVATVVGVAEYRIVGVVSLGTGGVRRTTLSFATERAAQLAGTPGRGARISIRVAPGADPETVRRSIAAVLPRDARVVTEQQILDDLKSQINQGLAIFTSVLLGFAAVTLFVSTFLIWNTFNIVVAQRTRELALLRALGASAKQVSRSVIAEGLIVGFVASAIGVGAGVLTAVGFRALLSSFGGKLPDAGLVVQPRSWLVGFAVGMGVTLISVLGPARRATTIAPVAAMQAAAVAASATGRRRLVMGLAVLFASIVIGVVAYVGTGFDSTQRTIAVGVAAVLMFSSVASLSAHIVGPVIGTIGAIPARFGSASADLARRNAIRAPRRVASTAAALMLGLALVSTTLVVGESIKNQLKGALTDSIHSDLIVSAAGVVAIDQTAAAKIGSTGGVADSITLDRVAAKVAGDDNDEAMVTLVDTSKLARYADPDLTEGVLPTTGSGIAVSKAVADAHNLHPGSIATIATATGTVRRTVTGVYRRDEIADTAIALPSALGGAAQTGTTRFVLVHTTGDVASVQKAIERVVASIPSAKVFTADGLVADLTSDVDSILAVINALLALAVLVAALGIANTLALSIVERTRELGLLRAIGMDRRSMRRMVRIEGVLLAVFGGLLGVGLGIVFGIAVVRILPAGTALLRLPIARLGLVFAAACMLGLLASILPARRAGRLNVLAAIAVD